MLFEKLLVFFSIAVVALCESDSLEQVDDEELLGLFRNEKHVVVLFTKSNCPECDKLETALTNIREDLVETCGAWVVKASSSPLVKLYSPTKEPAIVFFRHGVPLLYDGDDNEDAMAHFLTDNKEPVVKELTDETFEHLTQSSSGATTGDWFVMFYSNDCIDCQRLQARWETVGAKLKTRLNVARVNRKTTGRVTSRRFHIVEEPTFLLFRLGKMSLPGHP
uniref:Thioredoxin domain-containing protein n=1 Tax=Lygus hesperus TaxID=30085 RepID=A0A0A9YCS3_LYGHE